MEEPKTEEEKPETAPDDALLAEWATKIYKTTNEAFKQLVGLGLFENRDLSKKFMELMNRKKFGEFVEVSIGINLLHIKIAGQYIPGAEGYFSSQYHIGEIRKFLAGYGEKWTDVAQEILLRLAEVINTGKSVRRAILYPELGDMEAELKLKDMTIVMQKKIIDELELKLKEKDGRFEIAMGIVARMGQEVDSLLNSLLKRNEQIIKYLYLKK